MWTPRDIYNGNKILDSTCLDLAFAKPNMICGTDKLRSSVNYLILISKTEILHLTPLSLIDGFLFKSFLVDTENRQSPYDIQVLFAKKYEIYQHFD